MKKIKYIQEVKNVGMKFENFRDPYLILLLNTEELNLPYLVSCKISSSPHDEIH